MTRTGHRRSRLAAAIIVLAIGGCLGTPFERVNPNDPGADFTVTISATADSSRTIGEIIDFTATIAPPAPGYEAQWSVSHPALVSLSPGKYQVAALPPSGTLPVLVSARFATALVASHLIVLRPATP